MALLFFTIPAMVLALAVALVPLVVSTVRHHWQASSTEATRPSDAATVHGLETTARDLSGRAA